MNTTISSDGVSSRQRIAQNFFLIWINGDVNQSKNNDQNIVEELRSVVNDVYVFAQQDEAIDFLTEFDDMKVFLVVDDAIGQLIVPLIHNISQLDTICIVSENQSVPEHWTTKWNKIKRVYKEIKLLCKTLESVVMECNQDSIAVSFVPLNKGSASENLNQLEPNFMYTQLFKETLLEMEYDNNSIKDLATYCRTIYKDKMNELNIIKDLENNYHTKSPIWWYTRQSFIYQMLNQALRLLEGSTIVNMGFFIHDLHKQISQLHRERAARYRENPFVVYRGQGLLRSDFEKLLESKGGLISFNNFLSTSEKQEVSFRFAKNASRKSDVVGILYQMTIDSSMSSVPFASIREFSFFRGEEEILFSMHTIFRVIEITKLDNCDSLYQINLMLTADGDQDLRTLTEYIRTEFVDESGWDRLCKLLLRINQLDKAEELCNTLLEKARSEVVKAPYYNNLGCIKRDQGDYKKSIKYYEKSLKIQENTLPANHPDLATSYNNIGLVYLNMGEYSKSLSFYEKSLKMQEKTLSANHPDLATSYNNIGVVYHSMGERSKSLLFYEKSLKIQEKALPANHPDLAMSYSNIGSMYLSMGEYSKSLPFHEKSLTIREKVLPANHPDLAISYGNIGSVYGKMGEHSKSLSFYGKSLKIQENTLSANHPNLAASYNNIGSVYDSMGEYSKSLSFYEKSLKIQEKTLSANHPDLATSYNNIGVVYLSMGEYSKSLSFHEKSLTIREKVLPANHLDLAISYGNIGLVYESMGEHSKSISFRQYALNIFQNSLPPNHPYFKVVQENLEYF